MIGEATGNDDRDTRGSRYIPDGFFWAILVIALAIRLTAAMSCDFHSDEAFSYFIEHAPVSQVMRACRADAHPPIFHLLMSPLTRLTRQPFFLRLPNVAFSLCSFWFIAQLAYRQSGRWTVHWVCLLQACCYLVWNIEMMYRYTALFEVLNLAVIWSALEVSQPDGYNELADSTRWVYRCSCVMLPLTHLLGNFTVVAVALGLRKRGPKVWLWPCLGSLLSGLWLVFSLTGPASGLKDARFGGSYGGFFLPDSFLGLGLPLQWEPAWRQASETWTGPWGWFCAGLGWLIFLSGLVKLGRADGWGRCIVLAFLVPFGALSAASVLRGAGWFQVRYMVPYSAFFFIILVSGLSWARVRWLQWLLAPAVLAQLGTACLFPSDSFWWNQNWSSFTQFVGQRGRQGDVLAAYYPYSTLLGFNFLYNRGRVEVHFEGPMLRVDQPPGPLWLDEIPLTPSMLGPQLSQRLGSGRIFLLLNEEKEFSVRRWFAEHYVIEASLVHRSINSWGNTECYLMTPLPAGQLGASPKQSP